MRCDVVGILCRPDKCEDRAGCELRRSEPYYYKAEQLTEAQIRMISDQRIQIAQKRSLGKNLDHFDSDPSTWPNRGL